MKLLISMSIGVALLSFSVVSMADLMSQKFEIVPVAEVAISELSMEELGGQSVLTGAIKRAHYNSHVAPGHIDYVLLDEKRGVIEQGAVRYSPSLSLRAWKHGSSFSVLLPAHLPKNASIKVGYHQDKFSQNPAVFLANHEKNSLL